MIQEKYMVATRKEISKNRRLILIIIIIIIIIVILSFYIYSYFSSIDPSLLFIVCKLFLNSNFFLSPGIL
jgi:uncharacterized membrane protein YvbJ